MKKIITIIPATIFFLLLFSPNVLAVNHKVNVRFWLNRNATTPYCDEFLIVYFQNKTYNQGKMDYIYKCYNASYHGCVANISVPETNYFDLLFTNGAITWNTTNGCPSTVENYEVWATVQSNMYVDQDMDLDYLINITRSGEPRNYFWNTQSFRTILSIVTFIILMVIVVIVGYLTKSGLVALIIFLCGLAIKLIIGI